MATEQPQTPNPNPEETGFPEALGHLPFLVVGVGASAGGLEAFSELLEHLPDDTGMAFLYVQHLEPHRKSLLTEIVGRVTSMPVTEATERMPIEPNHVFLIPPNTTMTLADGNLTLRPRSGTPLPHMPIDYLFRSLAEIQKNRAIGVILSGGGTDGTLGFQAIKAEGGITFVQEQRSAKYDSMPRSAILDGSVDYILRPSEIARQLTKLARHPYVQGQAVAEPSAPEQLEMSGDINRVLELVKAVSGADFTHYKRTTIKRRILRRMALLGLNSYAEYATHLEDDPVEARNLYQDLLIRVTRFFRDPEVFELLKTETFPLLLRNRPPQSPIRMWVAGCSTGEEVYSLAINLLEFLGESRAGFPIKILATDINEVALERARAGIYPDNIELDVSPDHLRRYFVKVDGHYQISKTVRDLCVFSRHNLITDPPFSRLDLVSCRNVLIYMSLALQRRVLPIFHYSLNPGGCLLLGSSESPSAAADLFTAVNPRYRLYSKQDTAVRSPPDFSNYMATATSDVSIPGRETARSSWNALDAQKEADRIVLNKYAPVGVVVDEALTVLQFRGHTGHFLEPAPGLASLELLKMLRVGLLGEVRNAINKAKLENTAVRREGLRMKAEHGYRHVNVEVIPYKVPPTGARCFLVLFEDMPVAPPPPEPAAAPSEPGVTAEHQVAHLQQEIGALREYLQSVVEEYEVTNEELKSASEELLSANEELQSTNEELQTAKEETQSANEELATVNEELRHRNLELAQLSNDLVNLLNGVNIPIVMVSRDLRLRRFTPQAEKLLNLIPTDVGRPISDIKPNLTVQDLSLFITRVIDTLTPHESEIQDSNGHWYALRIRPYVTLDNKIDGASIVLLDIDRIKRSMEEQKQAQRGDGEESS